MAPKADNSPPNHHPVRVRSATEVPPLAPGIKIKQVGSPLRWLRRRQVA